MTLIYRNLTLSLNTDEQHVPAALERKLKLRRGSAENVTVLRKAIDSRRGRKPRFVYSVRFDLEPKLERKYLTRENPVVQAYEPAPGVIVKHADGGALPRKPVVIGAGPSGLFAAHRLTLAGVPPIVIDRGSDVVSRSKRWNAFIKGGAFDPECNLLYGEGGAGAYSDGKLYTRVHDPRSREVLEILAQHGAPLEILTDAKPHVGSNLLPSIIKRMREFLIEAGCEFRFETRFERLALTRVGQETRITGIEVTRAGTEGSTPIEADSVFLGTGHSARDVYRSLAEQNVAFEPKPFQMGVRIEHPQEFVNRMQYGPSAAHPNLPPAEYQLVAKRKDGDVFSFCMCPGGEILPATEQEGVMCVNGASKYKRTSPHGNSGFVVTVSPERFDDTGDAFGGVALQERVESAAWNAVQTEEGVPSYAVPAARLEDFLEGRVSESLPECSYPFPLVPANFDEILPDFVCEALRDGFRILSRRIRGFLQPDAVIVGPESRSSSPVRISRNEKTLQSSTVTGLYPMGEGAGYAGGILSAAIDGMRCAESWLTWAAKRAPAKDVPTDDAAAVSGSPS